MSIVSPFKDLRDNFKKDLKDNVVEIFVHTTDIRGREQFHVENYQTPTDNFINIDTTNKTVYETIEDILNNELVKKI
jgi:adenylylsulfate kinase